MQTLRQELIESQKVRSDFLKWKLAIVAGVGGAALGFSQVTATRAHLALLVLPLACAYVDLICRNNSLRNKAIGLFFEHGTHSDVTQRHYERFYGQIHDEVWKALSLETWALKYSTIVVSVAVAPIGIFAGGSWRTISPSDWSRAWEPVAFFLSLCLGLTLAFVIEARFKTMVEKAQAAAEEGIKDYEPRSPGPTSSGASAG